MAVVRVKEDVVSVSLPELPEQLQDGVEGAGIDSQPPGGGMHEGTGGIEGPGEGGTPTGDDVLQKPGAPGQSLNQQAYLALAPAPLAPAA
jgi:hypothetical protein